jgi:cysteine-rich repeat protein
MIRGSLMPAGDEDIFKFSNTSAQRVGVKFDLWNRTTGVNAACGNAIDPGLLIKDAAGTRLASNDDRQGVVDRCPGVVITLAPGESVYAQVVDAGDNSVIDSYGLQAAYFAITCGDGVRGPGETCDDGNTTPGDGCSAACALELTAEVEPNGTQAEAAASALEITGSATIQGSIAGAGDVDVYRVAVAAPTVVRFETLTSFYDCTAPTATDVRLFDAAGAPIFADVPTGTSHPGSSGISGCGAIVMPLPAGTYYVSVEERGNDAAIATYYLSIGFEADRTAETEPSNTRGSNDTTAIADKHLLDGSEIYVFGDHLDTEDVDVYAITVPPLGRIRAEVVEGDRPAETCEGGGVDTLMKLYDPGGTLLAQDEDGGRGLCSLLDGSGNSPLTLLAKNPTLTRRTYYLSVERSPMAFGQAQQFVYRLQVTIR